MSCLPCDARQLKARLSDTKRSQNAATLQFCPVDYILDVRPGDLPFIGGGSGPEVHPVPRMIQFPGLVARIDIRSLLLPDDLVEAPPEADAVEVLAEHGHCSLGANLRPVSLQLEGDEAVGPFTFRTIVPVPTGSLLSPKLPVPGMRLAKGRCRVWAPNPTSSFGQTQEVSATPPAT